MPKNISRKKTINQAIEGSNILIVCTPWKQYYHLSIEEIKRLMSGNIIIDPFRVFDGKLARQQGFLWYPLGKNFNKPFSKIGCIMKSFVKENNISRVVVLGGKGFVGSAIIKECEKNNIPTVALTRKNFDFTKKNSSDLLSSFLQPTDNVVAVAAKAPVKNLEMLTENVLITKNICSALSKQNINYLLNVGSDAVFQDSKSRLTEDSYRSPSSLHGVMHLMREISFDALGLSLGTIRPTLIYGVNDPHNGYGPNSFFRKAKSSENIMLFGKGEELRDHIFIDDVAKISVEMIRKKYVGSLNAATGEVTSFENIAKLCIEFSKGKSKIENIQRQGPMPHNGYRAFDISKLKLFLGNLNPTLIDNGLKKLF